MVHVYGFVIVSITVPFSIDMTGVRSPKRSGYFWRKIPYYMVPVSRIPPRPELQLIGIDYRKIPVLAINDTVYCDTFMIAQALEECHPVSQSHPSLYPKNLSTGRAENAGLQKLLVQFWTDRSMFSVAAGLLPWKLFPKEFIKDRSSFRATEIDPNKMEQLKPFTLSQFQLHLELLEQQLNGNETEYLLNTAHPGYIDVSAFFLLHWLGEVGMKEKIFGENEFPSVQKWMMRVEKYHESQQRSSPCTKITGQRANELIGTPPLQSLSSSSDARLFGLGTDVAVVPEDSGKIPTYGKLVGIDRQRILLDVQRRDGSGRSCRVCFPRLGFLILPHDSKRTVGFGKL
ncbi:uncharacterized protein MELLADRAFT_88550 [Melampsora larici-populina 98AG31]|uniref:GST C-terminal domain-containing protein n=1 Tax=Melampsora larici-populina (strain 98AG31 / pathotype 3-4-7) TaxID=747676 RepID=F4RS59_MELLP|nr:uncharacterized protein MELLADRAFT_88550 [Melampsora larici-populina 98AG31]EGG04834.1 hypothetical protein MELLADRAFT_88550 [Melampsora larici-populina 98AG31]